MKNNYLNIWIFKNSPYLCITTNERRGKNTDTVSLTLQAITGERLKTKVRFVGFDSSTLD